MKIKTFLVDQNGKLWQLRAQGSARQDGCLPVSIYCCVILLPLRGHKNFVVSLVDPFFIDCVTFHEYPSTYSTAKFHDIHGIQGYLWRFTFTIFSTNNIPVVVVVMISPFLIESSMSFFQSKILIYCIVRSKSYDVFLV